MTEGISNAEYHSHPATSKSDLDLAHKSALHLYDKLFGPPRESTPTFDFGTMFHAAVLPGESLEEIAIRTPDDYDGRTKAGKEFNKRVREESKLILNAKDGHAIDQMLASVQKHPFAGGLLNGDFKGKSEQSFFAVDSETGLELKARPDFILDDHSVIIDIKTTMDASFKGFQKSFATYRYHVQAAWYLWVVELATGKRPDAFCFVAVEKQRPYGVGVYVADADSIEIGMQEAKEDLAKIAKWKEEDFWPGYSDNAELMTLPPWMLSKTKPSEVLSHEVTWTPVPE